MIRESVKESLEPCNKEGGKLKRASSSEFIHRGSQDEIVSPILLLVG